MVSAICSRQVNTSSTPHAQDKADMIKSPIDTFPFRSFGNSHNVTAKGEIGVRYLAYEWSLCVWFATKCERCVYHWFRDRGPLWLQTEYWIYNANTDSGGLAMTSKHNCLCCDASPDKIWPNISPLLEGPSFTVLLGEFLLWQKWTLKLKCYLTKGFRTSHITHLTFAVFLSAWLGVTEDHQYHLSRPLLMLPAPCTCTLTLTADYRWPALPSSITTVPPGRQASYHSAQPLEAVCWLDAPDPLWALPAILSPAPALLYHCWLFIK